MNIIRKATNKDLEQIFKIEQQCFNRYTAYSKKQFNYLITKAHSSCFVETSNQSIRGFIIILYKKNSKIAGIETIDVDPKYQGKGIGTRLMHAAEEEIKKKGINKIRLEVSKNNVAAINLYKKLEYYQTAILHNYYQFYHDGTRDAIRMIKDLD